MPYAVTYLHHSGFLVSTGDYALIFDFAQDKLDPGAKEGAAVLHALESGRKVIAFASHAHADHYQRLIADWARPGQCALLLGSDIEKGLPGVYLSEGEQANVLGVQVSAFGSTDQGVSFLVEANGLNVFHAGDLNCWHWRAESSTKEVEQARRGFERVLDTLPRDAMDIAMFPVDGRMGLGHDEGAIRFIEHCRPKLFFPMHFWDDGPVAQAFAQRHFPGTRVVALTERGQRFEGE